ncbi:hypothetical protein ACYULU_14980 [Breznakiellaceae bacterium SP9]
MTEEEAWALEEEVTKNPLKVSGNGKNGFFAKRKEAAHLCGRCFSCMAKSYIRNHPQVNDGNNWRAGAGKNLRPSFSIRTPPIAICP